MSHVEKIKDDPRTPQELATAILDHEFTPAGPNGQPPAVKFRDHLIEDTAERLCDNNQASEAKHCNAFCSTLINLDEKKEPHGEHVRDFSHALEILHEYKKQSVFLRDSSALRPENFGNAGNPLEMRNSLLRKLGIAQGHRDD